MAVESNTTKSSSRTKADGYATIMVIDKNGNTHQIETQDAWLFAQKANDELNPVNSSLLKAAQANRTAYQIFQTLDNKERAKLIAKGEEPVPYYEVPAMIRIKVPANTATETQQEIQF